jgi:hypothetical protein
MLRNQSRGYYSINPAIEETEPNINALTSYTQSRGLLAKASMYSRSKPLVAYARKCPETFPNIPLRPNGG